MSRRMTAADEQMVITLVHRCVAGNDTVTSVAKELGISRTTAYELLQRGRAAGLYNVVVEFEVQRDLVAALREELRPYGVSDVEVAVLIGEREGILTPREQSDVLNRALVERANARVKVGAGEHLCVDDSPLARAFLEEFNTSREPRIVVRPLSLSPWHDLWELTRQFDVRATLCNRGVTMQWPYWPALPLGLDVKDVLDRPDVRATFGQAAPRPAACVLAAWPVSYSRTMDIHGIPEVEASSAVWLHALQLRYETCANSKHPEQVFTGPDTKLITAAYRDYKNQGVVGTLCNFALKSDGTVVSGLLETSCLGTHPDRLRAWREQGTTVVAVGRGMENGPAFRAALGTRAISAVIVDVDLAIQLLPPKKRPAGLKSIAGT